MEAKKSKTGRNITPWLKNLDAKTRVCVKCNKRKPLSKFYDKKPIYVCKIKQHTVHKMRRCKSCHYTMCKDAYMKRTTVAQRQAYMRLYMKNYVKKLVNEAKIKTISQPNERQYRRVGVYGSNKVFKSK